MKKQILASLFIASLSATAFALPQDAAQPQQTLASGAERTINRLAEHGSARTPAFRVAEDGSARTPGFRVAEDGSDRTPGFRVAEDGSDRTPGFRVAEDGS
ncbi:hypothetical protein OEJ36_29150, partial [Pseudomonas sp. PDM13]|nr:hypothetical protein [Pseudomonas sp. PDM13]